MASPSALLQESACWWQPYIRKSRKQTCMRFKAHIPLVCCQFAWLHTFRWLEVVFGQQVMIQCAQTCCVNTCCQVFLEMCGFSLQPMLLAFRITKVGQKRPCVKEDTTFTVRVFTLACRLKNSMRLWVAAWYGFLDMVWHLYYKHTLPYLTCRIW